MKWELCRRKPKHQKTTFGALTIAGIFECYTLEDVVRADPDPSTPENEAKVHGQTAIPAGRYQVVFENSPKFGPDTLTLVGVPGYKYIRIHSGVDADDTEGCIIVGDAYDEYRGTISGGKLRGVLNRLKEKARKAFAAGEEVWLTILDAEA